MSNIKDNVWLTKDQRVIPLNSMEDSHLQSAFLSLAGRDFDLHLQINELWRKANKINLLKSKLRKEADKRNLKLIYPDEKLNTDRFGMYFEAERKVNAMRPEKVTVATESVEH